MPLNLTKTKQKLKFIIPVILLLVVALAISTGLYLKSKSPKPGKPQETQPKFVIPSLSTRQQLPNNIQAIKKQIIESQIANERGNIVLYTSNEYKIIYVPTPDFFLATILKEPLETYKLEAQNWFYKFGLKQTDLCNLPLRFGLDSTDFSKTHPDFSPFPEGCSY